MLSSVHPFLAAPSSRPSQLHCSINQRTTFDLSSVSLSNNYNAITQWCAVVFYGFCVCFFFLVFFLNINYLRKGFEEGKEVDETSLFMRMVVKMTMILMVMMKTMWKLGFWTFQYIILCCYISATLLHFLWFLFRFSIIKRML